MLCDVCLTLYKNSEKYWLECKYENNLPQNCGRNEYTLQVVIFEERIILQETKVSEVIGKYASPNSVYNPEHQTYQTEKSEHENIANVYVYVCHWQT